MFGDLVGVLVLSGERQGEAELALRVASDLADDDADPVLYCTHVTGTVASGSDVEDVDFVITQPEAPDSTDCTVL